MKTITNKKVKKLATNKRTERGTDIKLDRMITPILKKFTEYDLLMALTLALSSKLILYKDIDKTVRRLLINQESRKSAEKSMRNAFEISKNFLKFITTVYIQKEEDKSTLSYLK